MSVVRSQHAAQSHAGPLQPADRREFGRRRGVWHAWITPSSLQRLACCVRNVSEGGALLELAVPDWLPVRFDLLVDGVDIRLECDLRHRGRHGVGVTFCDPTQAQQLMEYCNLQVGAASRQQPATTGGMAPPRLTSHLIRSILKRPE